jgi:hypothetical protein
VTTTTLNTTERRTGLDPASWHPSQGVERPDSFTEPDSLTAEIRRHHAAADLFIGQAMAEHGGGMHADAVVNIAIGVGHLLRLEASLRALHTAYLELGAVREEPADPAPQRCLPIAPTPLGLGNIRTSER